MPIPPGFRLGSLWRKVRNTFIKSEFRTRADPKELLLGWKEEKVENPHPLVGETADQKRRSNTAVLGAAQSQRGITGRLCLCVPEPKHICAPVPTPGHASELCTLFHVPASCVERNDHRQRLATTKSWPWPGAFFMRICRTT